MKMLFEKKDSMGRPIVKIYESEAEARSGAYRIHHHVECELSFILSGEGRYLADRSYPIKAGDIFFYKNNEPHCITDIAPGGMRIFNIHLSPKYFRQLSATEGGGGLGSGFVQMSFPGNRLADFMSESETGYLVYLLQRIYEEVKETRENRELLIDSCLISALILLSRSALPHSDAVSPSGPGRELIFTSADYIDLHFAEPLTLSRLAADVNLERTYYSRLFKRVIGLSPWDYILIRRVESAKAMLRGTDMNILDVAIACGFNNTANFNKLFKKYTGRTPKELR